MTRKHTCIMSCDTDWATPIQVERMIRIFDEEGIPATFFDTGHYVALDEYEKAWRPYEENLIKGMCDLLNMEFRQNIIDIYAAPFYTSFSFPMFIATKYEPDRAVEVIAHELLHVLLYDNTAQKLCQYSSL